MSKWNNYVSVFWGLMLHGIVVMCAATCAHDCPMDGQVCAIDCSSMPNVCAHGWGKYVPLIAHRLAIDVQCACQRVPMATKGKRIDKNS